jgi:hypothetical protein
MVFLIHMIAQANFEGIFYTWGTYLDMHRIRNILHKNKVSVHPKDLDLHCLFSLQLH